MWKLIKMDFYRLFSSKTIRVGALMSALMSLGYMLLSLGILAFAKFAYPIDPEMVENMQILLSQASWMNGVNFARIVFGSTSMLSLFIGCMITANFIGSEQSCGYTKNFAGLLPDKGYMVISKFVVTSIAQLMVLLVYVVVTSVLAFVFFGRYIDSYSIDLLLTALGVRLILHFAVNAIIVFVCSLTKSHAVGMVVGCIFGIGITKVAYFAVETVLRTMKINFPIGDYMPDGINGRISLYSAGDMAAKAILISVAFIVVFLGVDYYVVRKRDVR